MSYLIDIAENCLFDGLVLDNLTQDTTVTTTNDKDFLWVWVRIHRKMGDHLLVTELTKGSPSAIVVELV